MSEALYEQRPLEDAVERHIGGGTPPRQVLSYWKGEIPWASVKDFPEQKGVIQDTEEHISSTGLHASASNLIPAQTPLVCTRMAVGRAALPVIPMAINQDVKALFPASGVSAEYLLKLMQYIQPLAEGRAVGSTVKGIRIQEYLNIPVPLAPQEAQPVIAQILDTLDTAIRETEALIDKLNAVKQGLLHDLLTRGIDVNGQLRPPQSAAPQLYKESPLGWIPREWEVDLLGDVAESLIDGPFGSNLKTAHYVENPGVRVVRLQNIQLEGYDDSDRAFISDKHATSLLRNRVAGGDVLIASLGDNNYPVGRACCYPTDLPDAVNKADCFRFRAGARCHNEFIMLFMNCALVRRQVRGYEQGVTMKRINLGNLRRIVVALPDLAEQERIIERMQAIRGQLEITKLQHGKLQQKKSGLMDDLLAGRVRVTPLLEPAQEPAAPMGA